MAAEFSRLNLPVDVETDRKPDDGFSSILCAAKFKTIPFTYSNVEYADMVFIYGLCNGSAGAAVQEYKRKCPNRRSPSARVFYSIFQHLCNNGTFPGRPIRATAERMDHRQTLQILDSVQHSPGISTKRISCRLGVSNVLP